MSKTMPEWLRDATGYIEPEPCDNLRALLSEAAAESALHSDQQPQERNPLTDDKAVEGFCSIPHPTHYLQAFIAGVRFAESEHGIKEKT